MELRQKANGSYTEVLASGRLNMVSAPNLRAYIDEVVASGVNRIVVNLADTTFMDSSGLGALIGCLKAARQAGGDLRIAAVQPQVKMVLELTSMDRVLTSYVSGEAAFGDE